MHPELEQVRCAIVRGGTSKAIFLLKNELPNDPVKRDRVIQAIYGSPDIRQIDGLGGADVLTSKLAIISPSTRPDADVDYTFGQVSITDAIVDYGGNCGNISSAVGPFAIDEGLVTPVEPVTTVRIHLTNSGNILVAEVPVKDGKARVEGDCKIDGCPGSGARITLDWSDVVGGFTGKLLPTGNVKDRIAADDETHEVTIVDAGTPTVFIHARSLGMTGVETPAQIEENAPLMARIERIRGEAAVLCGFAKNWREAARVTPYQPFFAIVSPPAPYQTIGGGTVAAGEIDLVSRLLFMLRMHKTYAVSGTVATGAAVRIPGSVAWEALREAARHTPTVRIGHPGGVIPVEAIAETNENGVKLKKIGVYRTARRIMDGYVYVRKTVFA